MAPPRPPTPGRRPRSRRSRGRAVLVAAAAPVVAAAVLGAEVEAARGGGPPLAAPAGVDGCVGCAGPAGTAPLRVAWLGDSTAAGVGATSADATLPRQVAARLGRPVELTVLARSGARLAGVVRDQLPRLAPLHPDVVVVSVGANDAVHLTGARAYAELWDRLAPAPGVRLVALGIPDMGAPPRLAQPLRAVVGWRARWLDRGGARRLGKEGVAVAVDIAGATGPAFRRDPARYFAADRYHPSDAGYALWADAVARVLAG